MPSQALLNSVHICYGYYDFMIISFHTIQTCRSALDVYFSN